MNRNANDDHAGSATSPGDDGGPTLPNPVKAWIVDPFLRSVRKDVLVSTYKDADLGEDSVLCSRSHIMELLGAPELERIHPELRCGCRYKQWIPGHVLAVLEFEGAMPTLPAFSVNGSPPFMGKAVLFGMEVVDTMETYAEISKDVSAPDPLPDLRWLSIEEYAAWSRANDAHLRDVARRDPSVLILGSPPPANSKKCAACGIENGTFACPSCRSVWYCSDEHRRRDWNTHKFSCRNRCAVCGVASTKRCGRCKRVYYCGKEHQQLHWNEHKRECSSRPE